MALKAFKIGLRTVGLGLVCFVLIGTVMGPLGPCAGDGQSLVLLIGSVLLGIGGLGCLLALPISLFERYRARGASSRLSSLEKQPRTS